MGSHSISAAKPHAVCIPFPAQGHVPPMLNLAKLLHLRGFHITYVTTEYNRHRLLDSRDPYALAGLPDFRFATIPDGLPPSASLDITQDIPSLCHSTSTNCLAPFRELLSHLQSHGPSITCIIADGIMSFALDAAKELGVPGVLLWTTSACGYMGYFHFKRLIDHGLVPLKHDDDLTNGYLDTVIDWAPGTPDIRLRDVPTFIRTTDPDDKMLRYCIREIERAAMASAVVLNTFEDLERPVLDAMGSVLDPPVYTVGPLDILSRHLGEPLLATIGSNLWKEDLGFINWLEGKRSGSVVYVNFGSIAVMSNEQLVEFAWGLANSKQDFLWVIRPDLVRGDTAVLPPEFLTTVGERGLLASWCPQLEVLEHPAIGGFLTHSGWNSTLESLCAGVPMLCWPVFAEQQMNCRYACTEWGVGMEIVGNVKREVVEEMIKELMEGEKGKEMRRKAAEWKENAAKATKPGGTSFVNFDRLINEVLLCVQAGTKEKDDDLN